jgi:small subunit ribosomal protein S6
MKYELFYLIGISKESEVPTIKDAISSLVKSLDGVFEEKEVVEKRKLAYDIKHERQGIYVAQRFELENIENIKELNTKLNLNQDILRFIISKADELPELKTKEEREKQFANQENRRSLPKKESFSEKKASQESEKNKPAKNAPKEPTASKEDIDKKLEEILNI